MKQKAIDLSIIIVNHKTPRLLDVAISNAVESCQKISYQIIVIDNESNGDSNEIFKKWNAHTTIINNKKNIGYAAALNVGLNNAQGRYVLFLNADVIINSSSVSELVDFMDANPEVGLAGPKLVFPNGDYQHSCRSFYNTATVLLRRTFLGRFFPNHSALRDHLMLDSSPDETRDVDWVIGAAVMVRHSAIRALGGIDERYFLYFEDVDLCRRMKMAGWRVVYYPRAVMVHHYTQESRRKGPLGRTWFAHLASAVRYWSRWHERKSRLSTVIRTAGLASAMALDFLVLSACTLLAQRIQVSLGGGVVPAIFPLREFFTLFFFYTLFAILLLFMDGHYYPHSALKTSKILFSTVLKLASAGLITLFYALASDSFRFDDLRSTALITSFIIISLPVFLLTKRIRIGLHSFFWKRRFFLKRLVVVGQGPPAREVVRQVRKHPELGYEIVGLISHNGRKPDRSGNLFRGSFDRLFDCCRAERADGALFLGLEDNRFEVVSDLIRLRLQKFDIKILSPLPSFASANSNGYEFAGIPAMDYSWRHGLGLSLVLKRLLDLAVSLSLLILFMPLLAFCFIQMKLSDSRVLSGQTRIGPNGRPFTVYKFITVIPGSGNLQEEIESESLGGPFYEPPDDLRATKFGAWLRRFNLGALPQLLNVLKGQMSLVGPPPPLVSESGSRKVHHAAGLQIKPGITGLRQINEFRTWNFEKTAWLDLEYILHRSLLLDIKIMIQTLRAMVLSGGSGN